LNRGPLIRLSAAGWRTGCSRAKSSSCAKTMLRVDLDDFNLVDGSRITRESSTSSHATGQDSPCP
jgi:hypothetical protein